MTRYEILEPFGPSLVGSYSKAWDRELERFVLLCLLPSALFPTEAEQAQCLRRSAKVAALRHPSLLPLHETGETREGGVFQVFTWAEGEMLARRLEAGPLKPVVALDLTAQVAAGLALAHRHGIVHGRLDPSSVLVTRSGEAKLLDLASPSDERTWISLDGTRWAAWLAPEQRQGFQPDARSDVWGLGAMLYEMVTGVRPRSERREPLSSLRADASRELERIVERALSPMPADRPVTAEELWSELAALAQAGSHPLSKAEPKDADAGLRLGHYRLLKQLGAGGMGVVYRAEDTRLGRTVALKLLPPELSREPAAKARFFKEARTASALEHPNLCTVYDAGQTEDGRLWIAMPCYDGENLRSRLERGPLPAPEALDVARQVARGLAKAHKQGIVHRDIKPANLMLTGDGVVKILDFGIAKLAGEAGLTRTGAAIGTPGYMSPEQALGDVVDHRTDLWALGAVLYEMLAGRRPFSGDHPAGLREAILHQEVEPLADVPREVQAIVRRLLEKDAAARYVSAEEVVDDLQAALLGLPVAAPARRRPRIAWPPRRNVWTAGALLVLPLAAGLAGWLLRPADREAARPTFRRLTDQGGVELYPSLSPSGDFFVYAKRDGGDLDVFLQRVGGSQPINLTPDSPVDDTQPAFSPDGTQIAFRSERLGGGLFLMGATGESVRRLARYGYQPSWSPDGRRIAVSTVAVDDPKRRTTPGEIWTIDVATGANRRVLEVDAVQPSWSPTGLRIAYWRADLTGKRSIWTARADGSGRVRLTSGPGFDWGPTWSPDGAVYFFSDRSGSMNFWRVGVDEKTGRPQDDPEPAPIPAEWSGFASFSRDGRRMIYATRERRGSLEWVQLDPSIPRAVGSPELVTRGTSVFSHASVSPEGDRIVLSLFGDREDLAVVHRGGGALHRLTDDDFKDRLALWAPDGRILFYSDRQGHYNAWSIEADGSGLRPLINHEPALVFDPIASPDGKSVAVCGDSAGAGIIDLTAPLQERRVARLPPSPWGSFCPSSWSRDGERLLGKVLDSIVVFSFSTGLYEKLSSGKKPVWMADGKRFLYLDVASDLSLFDLRTRETREVEGIRHDPGLTAFALSPDNRWLYLVRSLEEGDLWLSHRDRM